MSADAKTIAENLSQENAQARLRLAWQANHLEYKKPYNGRHGRQLAEVFIDGKIHAGLLKAIGDFDKLGIKADNLIQTRRGDVIQIIFKTGAEDDLKKFDEYINNLPKSHSEALNAINAMFGLQNDFANSALSRLKFPSTDRTTGGISLIPSLLPPVTTPPSATSAAAPNASAALGNPILGAFQTQFANGLATGGNVEQAAPVMALFSSLIQNMSALQLQSSTAPATTSGTAAATVSAPVCVTSGAIVSSIPATTTATIAAATVTQTAATQSEGTHAANTTATRLGSTS